MTDVASGEVARTCITGGYRSTNTSKFYQANGEQNVLITELFHMYRPKFSKSQAYMVMPSNLKDLALVQNSSGNFPVHPLQSVPYPH